jgi:hypothetical protein
MISATLLRSATVGKAISLKGEPSLLVFRIDTTKQKRPPKISDEIQGSELDILNSN